MWNSKEDSLATVMFARRIAKIGSALERMWEKFMGESPNVMCAVRISEVNGTLEFM